MRREKLTNWPIEDGFASLRNSLPESFSYHFVAPRYCGEIPEPLAKKSVLAIQFSSGTDTEEIRGVILFRIDGDELDQHTLIAGQNFDTNDCWSHVHQHADYCGRTTPIDDGIIEKLWESSTQQVVEVLGLPQTILGDVRELDSLGLVRGIHEAYKLKMNPQYPPNKKGVTKTRNA